MSCDESVCRSSVSASPAEVCFDAETRTCTCALRFTEAQRHGLTHEHNYSRKPKPSQPQPKLSKAARRHVLQPSGLTFLPSYVVELFSVSESPWTEHRRPLRRPDPRSCGPHTQQARDATSVMLRCSHISPRFSSHFTRPKKWQPRCRCLQHHGLLSQPAERCEELELVAVALQPEHRCESARRLRTAEDG